MKQSMRAFLLGCLISGLAAPAGCGDPRPTGPFVPVKGKVMLGGKPLVGGVVTLVPLEGGEVQPPLPMAEINAQGFFSIKTGGKEGAPVGTYRATVVTAGVDKDQESLFDPVYSNWERSPLIVEATEDAAASVHDFTLVPFRQR